MQFHCREKVSFYPPPNRKINVKVGTILWSHCGSIAFLRSATRTMRSGMQPLLRKQSYIGFFYVAGLRLSRDVVACEYVGTHLMLSERQSNQYCNVQVDEATFTEAFLNFITAMACSDAVYAKEETLKMIRRAMESMT